MSSTTNENKIKEKDIIQKEPVPYIKREIDGVTYTVIIHFNPGSRETAKKKIERLLLNEVLNETSQN